MRRVIASSVVASAMLIGAIVARGAEAPLAIGGPAGGFVVPIGSVASFTSMSFSACNSLTWGYQLSGGSNQPQSTFPGGCTTAAAPTVTIGPFATPTSFRVFLTDNRCGATYYSDGTPVDHTIVTGSNPFTVRFADAGGICEHKTITFNAFSGCNFCVTVAIDDQAVSASGKDITTTESTSVTASVATFTDADPTATAADYTANIDWGDGTSSTGVITATTGFAVSGTHDYPEEGTYTIKVTIVDVDDSSNSATTSSTAHVADAALTAAPACSASALGAYNSETATFTDTDASLETAADFAATINWGDGTTATGTVTSTGGGTYGVSGSHHYASTGQFTIRTTVIDDGGSTARTECNTVGFLFAPGGGTFVVGGQQNSAIGRTVTFWGAHWATLNLPNTTPMERRFKGLAESPASPACGDVWSADPGSSTPPPAGPLPEYMGIIVTGSVTQSGASVSGKVMHIVVVKTNPGYAPNPGHNGNGTVVAVVC